MQAEEDDANRQDRDDEEHRHRDHEIVALSWCRDECRQMVRGGRMHIGRWHGFSTRHLTLSRRYPCQARNSSPRPLMNVTAHALEKSSEEASVHSWPIRSPASTEGVQHVSSGAAALPAIEARML